MAVVGFQAKIKKSGTSTSFTGESMTVTTGNTYQIDDSAKQVFNFNSTFTFYEDAVAISDSDIDSIDYMYGKVTFSTSKTGSITVDGAYYPMGNIAGAYQATQNSTNQVLNTTSFENQGYVEKLPNQKDIIVTCTRFDDLSKDFQDILEGGNSIVIEFLPSTGNGNRGWYVLDSASQNLDMSNVIEESLSFQLTDNKNILNTFSRE